jgi:hypothetical protein
VLKLFRHVCKLLMLIVEDRRHVDVPSHSVKFDSSHGLMHPLSWGLCTHSCRQYNITGYNRRIIKHNRRIIEEEDIIYPLDKYTQSRKLYLLGFNLSILSTLAIRIIVFIRKIRFVYTP